MKQSAKKSGSTDAQSTLTVVIALGANALVAIAKSAAAFLTGSASMVAEAAHSWADTGNEVLLLVANKRGQGEPTRSHPLGFGREAYVWSMFAAMGLFIAGSAVSIMHGVQVLVSPEPGGPFLVAYIVLAVSFVFEGISFTQAYRQTRAGAREADRDVLEHALATSDPMLRAVFAEDAAALIGIVLAAAGIVGHQLTGSAVPDALGSIAVGLLLGTVALVLIDRNRRFLVGEGASPQLRGTVIDLLKSFPEVDHVTYLRLEYVGPRKTYLVASVDIVGDAAESTIADTLRGLERRLEEHPAVLETVLTVSTPDEAAIHE